MIPLKSLDLWSKIVYTSPLASQKTLLTAMKLYEIHGLTLFTTILPSLGKALDRAMSGHKFEIPKGILKLRKNRTYPVFLHEFFSRIIDKDGYIISDRAHDIKFLRTILYMYYKYELPFTDVQLASACARFVATDQDVKVVFNNPDLWKVRHFFRQLLPEDPFDIRPRHSGGATADKVNNIAKREVVRYIPSLHSVFDITKYFFNANIRYSKEYFSSDPSRRTAIEPIARVTFVPKDSRGPRTICMEPHERMYVQQGLMHKIYEFIENYSEVRGRINFTNQSINQDLAYSSSIDRHYATIDLKDASDLVSWPLLQLLCDEEYLRVFEALRTPAALLPDGTCVTLNKFAPMGSALCFPVEAMIFYSIVRTITSDVYIYGDDIIIPNDLFNEVIIKLESYGLKVNVDKSLSMGYFRESCGGDFYRGHNVTPIRYRRDDVASVVAFANNISDAFGTKYGLAVIELFESINNIIIPRLPSQYRASGVLGFYTEGPSNLILFRRRWNNDLQVFEYRLPMTTTVVKKRASDSVGALIDYYTMSYGDNSPCDDSKYTIRLNGAQHPLDVPVTYRTTISTNVLKWNWATEM